MRIFTKTFFVLLVIGLVSCDEMNERVLPNCTGKAGDLLIVADSVVYNHQTGDALKNIFAQEQVGLPQEKRCLILFKCHIEPLPEYFILQEIL